MLKLSHYYLSLFFLLLTSTFLMSCAASIQDLSKVQYEKEGFTPDTLIHYGIALLPVVAGQGQEGYRRPFGDAINTNIKNNLANIDYIPWQQTMDLINKYSLTQEYNDIIVQYQTTAIIDKNLMNDLGAALNVRYLLFVSLEDFSKSESTSYNLFLGWNTKKTAIVNGFAQLWDCSLGDVAWEGYGTAYSEGGSLSYEKDYQEYSNVAARGLVSRLFHRRLIDNEKSSNDESSDPYNTWDR